MLLFYVDESGNTGVPIGDAGRGRYFALAAVGVRDSSREALAREIRSVRIKYFGEKAVAASWAETELKARHIQALTSNTPIGAPNGAPLGWAGVAEHNKLNNLTRDLEKVFAKFRPLVFAAVVDKSGLPEGDSAVATAYARLYIEVAKAAANVYVGESVLFVADRQDEHERLFRSGAVHESRRKLAPKGPARPDFNLIIDTPIWLDPSLSTWDREIIQLADLVALAAREWALQRSAPKHSSFMWRAMVPCFALHWHETTAVKAGLTIYPPPKAYPPIA